MTSTKRKNSIPHLAAKPKAATDSHDSENAKSSTVQPSANSRSREENLMARTVKPKAPSGCLPDLDSIPARDASRITSGRLPQGDSRKQSHVESEQPEALPQTTTGANTYQDGGYSQLSIPSSQSSHGIPIALADDPIARSTTGSKMTRPVPAKKPTTDASPRNASPPKPAAENMTAENMTDISSSLHSLLHDPFVGTSGDSSITADHYKDGRDQLARTTQNTLVKDHNPRRGRPSTQTMNSPKSQGDRGRSNAPPHDTGGSTLQDTGGQASAGSSHADPGEPLQRTERRSSRKPTPDPKPPSLSDTSLGTGSNQETDNKSRSLSDPVRQANPKRVAVDDPTNGADFSPTDQKTSGSNLQPSRVSPRIDPRRQSKKGSGNAQQDANLSRLAAGNNSKVPPSTDSTDGSGRLPNSVTNPQDHNASSSRMTDEPIRASDSSRVTNGSTDRPSRRVTSPSAATEASTNFSDSYILIGFYADMLTDAEAQRIATANRLRVLTDEREHGHGLSPLLPEIAVVESILAQQAAVEHQLELTLKRAMKRHPLGPWAASKVGIGEKQLGRFLGAVGDPATRPSVKQLNAYCGMDVRDGVAPHRKKGEKSNWKEEARSRLRLLAESCIKQALSPYRPVYDAGRARYADSVHAVECPQCGLCKNCGKPPGRPFAPCCDKRDPAPAPVGSTLRDGHKHARALRLVAKRILEDLYNEAVQVKEAGDG